MHFIWSPRRLPGVGLEAVVAAVMAAPGGLNRVGEAWTWVGVGAGGWPPL